MLRQTPVLHDGPALSLDVVAGGPLPSGSKCGFLSDLIRARVDWAGIMVDKIDYLNNLAQSLVTPNHYICYFFFHY